MNWYLEVLKNFGEFTGRARRKEYWMFVLFNMIFGILAIVLDNVLGITIGGSAYGPIYGLYTFAMIIPGITVAVRRLHDVGQSGKMLFLALIPLIGAIVLLVQMTKDSDPGENKYGPNPKGVEGGEFIANTAGDVDGASKDMVIFIVVLWMIGSSLFWNVGSFLIDNFYSGSVFKVFNFFSTFIWAGIPIILATLMKDETKRMILFILGGIYFLHGLYKLAMQFI